MIRAVLTGGPGGGKTEALLQVQNRLAREGIRVIIVPETATELILAGLSPRGILSNEEFQKAQLDLQLEREEIYARAAGSLPEKTVLLCDRGALDGEAFSEKGLFEALLAQRGLSRQSLLERYDAVFHMTSAACGPSSLYSVSNNPARKETALQAVEEDKRLLEIWKDHPCHQIIPVFPSMEEKTGRLIELLRRLIRTSPASEGSSKIQAEPADPWNQ